MSRRADLLTGATAAALRITLQIMAQDVRFTSYRQCVSEMFIQDEVTG